MDKHVKPIDAVAWIGVSGRWSKWHGTDADGVFTLCGRAVVLMQGDGSPQSGEISKINCRRCLQALQPSKGEGVRP